MANRMIDTLRGMYVRIPPPVKKYIGPLLSILPADLKYGSTYRSIRNAIDKSRGNPDFVTAFRNEQLSTLLRKSFSHSVYYRDVISNLGIDLKHQVPSDLDIAAFPILKKDVLRECAEELLTKSKDSLDLISTSGSSGRPLTFYLDKDRSVKEWAFIHYIWSRAGYRADDRRAVLRGVHMSNVDKRPWEYDAALRELRLSPFHLTKDHMNRFLGEMSKRGIQYLHGYPSALGILAKHAANLEWEGAAEIKGIFPISESLYAYQRLELGRVFPNATIIPFYGLSEKVAFAGELEGVSNTYEFEPLYGITELVDDDGQPVTSPGDKGRIISTGLLNLGMPFIRYDTEDEAELVQFPSESNAFRLQVRNIRSRWSQEFIVGAGGELISIAAINVHSSAYKFIREFQFFQQQPGYVDVRVVPGRDASAALLQEFVKEIQNKVGKSVKFTLNQVDQVEKNTRGKSKFIDQKLDLDQIQKDASKN